MAVGTHSLAEMTLRVRTAMRTYTPVNFSDSEIAEAMNGAQGKVFLSLNSEIKQNIYGTTADVTPSTSDGKITVALPSSDKVWDIVACKHIYTVDADIVTAGMFKADISFVLSVSTNDFKSGTHWARVGENLYLSDELTGTAAKCRMFYVRRPGEMGILDVPDEYARLVVLMSAADLLILAKDAPRDALLQLRQEVLYETKSLGLYPDREGSMLADADQPQPPGGSHGERPVQQ